MHEQTDDALPDDLALRQSLRDGLHALLVPPVTPDFDARVLDALRAPMPWWRRWWQPAQPLLLGASCSLSVTLVLLHWTLSTPAPRPPIMMETDRAQASAPIPVPSLDSLLDRPDLHAGSLAAVWGGSLTPEQLHPANNEGTGVSPSPDRRPELPRHAQVGRHSCLVV